MDGKTTAKGNSSCIYTRHKITTTVIDQLDAAYHFCGDEKATSKRVQIY
jgi:hypothetical protein